ncbi:MAG: serine/threonine-protein kinase [Elusimicrobiota bacterium]|nr:serine/threonine-protein kinase [Elusimicrobiota bacterium]
MKHATVIDSAYRIVSAAREGGMAKIYRAVRIKDNKVVALKILKEELRRAPDALGRLNHEEEIGLLLNHKNITNIYPHDGEKSFPYIVMEYVEGPTLAEFIEKHRWLVVSSALKIIMQMIDALEYIHSMGVIHQDLKPENIIMLSSGGIKILDFGLSYYSRATSAAWKNALSIGGTPSYTSPQRLEGDISSDTDIFASGVILYEMLTGSLPYKGENIVSFARGKLTSLKVVSPSRRNSSIHPKLENVIMRAISLEKKDRFVSATAFGYAVATAAKKSLNYKKRKVDWLLVVFLISFAAAAFIGFQFYILFYR